MHNTKQPKPMSHFLKFATILPALVLPASATAQATTRPATQPAASSAPTTHPSTSASAHHASNPLVAAVESAHNANAYNAHPVVRFDFTVEFGGAKPVDGVVTFEPATFRSKIEQASGAIGVFDGKEAYVTPDAKSFPAARFHLLTWPYFFAVPYKLQDGGTTLTPDGTKTLQGKTYNTAYLRFAPGTGDAPDDWYLLFTDPQTGRLEAMAYIVTYFPGQPAEKRSTNAIVYSDFKTFGTIPMATTYTFYGYSPTEGLVGPPKGKATVSNVTFPKVESAYFDAPLASVIDPLPAKK